MRCDECREKLVDYIEGLLPDQETQQFQSHLRQCSQCRTELDQLTALGQRLTSDAKNRQLADVENRVVNRIICEQNKQLKEAAVKKRQPQLWRIIMKAKITKLAAAAVILIAALLSLTLFDKTAAPVYALEQTIQASHSVRSIHFREYHPNQESPILMWAEFLPDGQVKQFRLSVPAWDAPQDGPKEIIWQDNAAQIWFKKKNSVMIVQETEIKEQLQKGMEKGDPKRLFQKLDELSRQNEADVQIEQPDDFAKPIQITATFTDKEFEPILGSRMVAMIDQATKLALSVRLFQSSDTGYKEIAYIEFYDYNQPIDPNTFIFNNLPPDVRRFDQVAHVIGLEQEQMTDDQIAVEVVRQFWQAMLNNDFAKASQMYEGAPVETLEKAFTDGSKRKLLGIVSIGPVQPHPNPKTGGVIVPCTITMEVNGEIVKHTFDKIGVRQVYNQPGRWTIFGGL